MTQIQWTLSATLGSMLLLGGAFLFQHIGDLPPCKLCLWQRWPHAVAILIGGLVWVSRSYTLAWVGALALLITAMIGGFHVGVEQGWWEGPASCTAGAITDLTTEELMAQIMAAPIVRCDDILWSFLGLSMAAWNGVLSLVLASVWVKSALK